MAHAGPTTDHTAPTKVYTEAAAAHMDDTKFQMEAIIAHTEDATEHTAPEKAQTSPAASHMFPIKKTSAHIFARRFF